MRRRIYTVRCFSHLTPLAAAFVSSTLTSQHAAAELEAVVLGRREAQEVADVTIEELHEKLRALQEELESAETVRREAVEGAELATAEMERMRVLSAAEQARCTELEAAVSAAKAETAELQAEIERRSVEYRRMQEEVEAASRAVIAAKTEDKRKEQRTATITQLMEERASTTVTWL